MWESACHGTLYWELEAAMTRTTSQIARTPGAADLRRAIDEHDLTLYYQPKFDCADERTLIGAEALIR